MGSAGTQEQINAEHWQAGDHLPEYANRTLRPVEVVLLARYREALTGRVLELGCGAGRLLGYFVELGAQAQGIDLAPSMVDYCRRAYPAADVRVGDLTSVGSWDPGPLDCVFASFSVIDVLDDSDRRRVLSDIRGLLAPGGLLIFSSHNLAAIEPVNGNAPGARSESSVRALAKRVLDRPPSWTFDAARRLPRRRSNRRRLAALERRTDSYAILNDVAHDYGLLHYYITRERQEQQLSDLGYELVECLDLDGRAVAAGTSSRSTELHYVARLRQD